MNAQYRHWNLQVKEERSGAGVKISGEDTKRKDEGESRKDAEEKRGGHMLHAVFQIFPM